ncbi:MAG: hypothetical protein WD492_05510 [Alkalispirochaeta sp.]
MVEVRTIRSRLMVAIAVYVTVVTVVAAQENYQKTYPLRSPEYEALRALYIEQGSALPFSSGPFPEAEIRASMDRVDYGELSQAGRTTYDWLQERLRGRPDYQEENGRFQFEVTPEFTFEGYAHTDSDNPIWEHRWEDRRPFARFPLEAWVSDHAYGVFDLAFMKNIPDFSLYPTYGAGNQYQFDADGDFGFSTEEEDPWSNLPTNVNTLDVQFPHRAFLSVGGERWNAQVGRDVIDWGNGRTGNLYISDYADWHDALQLSTFWERFKFSWIWVSLDGKLTSSEREFEIYQVGWDTNGDGVIDTTVDPAVVGENLDTDTENVGPFAVAQPDVEHKNLIAQRFELRLWDRLGLTYTEGIIFGREQVELRHLNPLYHYHNLYTNTQYTGNAHRSFEFDFAVTPGLSLYGILSPDQWTSPLEPGTGVTDEPNAVAYLAGLDYRRPLGSGYVKGVLEGVYATPWMHIHNSPLTSITNRRFVMAQHGNERTQIWIDRPLGHYGGNDFALIWMDVSYGEVGRYRYGFNSYYEGDGSVPINALLQSKVTSGLRDSPTEEEATMTAPSSGYDAGDGSEGETQWRTAASVYGEIWPWFFENYNGSDTTRTLRLGSELSAQWTRNRLNLESDWAFDLQWVVSATIGF